MRVFITGGTGSIGKTLVRRLIDRGDVPVVLSRRSDAVRRDPAWRKVQVVQGDPSAVGGWDAAVDGCDAIINLVGHNIFAQRWNGVVRRKIRDSRVYSTEHVVAAAAKAHHPPKVLVQASAIGYYGPRSDDEALTEDSPLGSDFMAVVCREWEESAARATDLGMRLVCVRTGVVLAKGEGALSAMTPIYKWVPGGAAPVGSGDSALKPGRGAQWFSWIHLDDIVGLFLLALDRTDAHGPLNGTAPNPVRHTEFGRALAKVFRRPYAPIGPPDLMLELMLGEVAQVITKGQRVLPAKAEALGYHFLYPDILPALQAIFAKPDPVKSEPAPAKVAAGHH